MKVLSETFRSARKRLLKMHYESGVGHIGGNLSCLDVLLVLHHEYIGPSERFILSKGHSVGALYVTLWSRGLLSDAQLEQFHRDDTLLAGHPPAAGLPGISFATGSLGHGLSLAAGTALALKLKRAGGSVYCLASDGEWQEGGHLGGAHLRRPSSAAEPHDSRRPQQSARFRPHGGCCLDVAARRQDRWLRHRASHGRWP